MIRDSFSDNPAELYIHCVCGASSESACLSVYATEGAGSLQEADDDGPEGTRPGSQPARSLESWPQNDSRKVLQGQKGAVTSPGTNQQRKYVMLS